MEPSPGADPGLLHYKSRVAAVRDGMEPSSGADPDHLPYEGKVTAVCDGLAGEPGLEPGLSWARTRRVAGLHHSPSLVPAQPARLAVRILWQLALTMSHFLISASSRPDTPIGSRGRFPSGLDDPAMSTGGGSRTRMGLPARQLLRLLCIPFHHARVVRRPRIELGTFRVRACCSAS
jgi:hypothetical protein